MVLTKDVLTRIEKMDLDRGQLLWVLKILADSCPDNVAIALDQLEGVLTD
jgi:hypothetical protein